MSKSPKLPVASSFDASFKVYLGARFASAGLGVVFPVNGDPGIHFEAGLPNDYRDAIIQGLRDGISNRFSAESATACVRVTRIDIHEVDSSWVAFYRAARMVVEQAYVLSQPVDVAARGGRLYP